MSINLSEHFTLDEGTITQVRNVNNYPPVGIIAKMQYAASRLEVVRTLLKGRILVSSWYRSPAVNKAVGGSKNSKHMEGLAIDFICPDFGTPYEVCKAIEMKRAELKFDQLIYEHTWVHISFAIPPAAPRLECLTLQSAGGYVQGIVFNPNPTKGSAK